MIDSSDMISESDEQRMQEDLSWLMLASGSNKGLINAGFLKHYQHVSNHVLAAIAESSASTTRTNLNKVQTPHVGCGYGARAYDSLDRKEHCIRYKTLTSKDPSCYLAPYLVLCFLIYLVSYSYKMWVLLLWLHCSLRPALYFYF